MLCFSIQGLSTFIESNLSAIITLIAVLIGFTLKEYSDMVNMKVRHNKVIDLFIYEFRETYRELSEVLSIKKGERFNFPKKYSLSIEIYDLLKKSSMPSFKPENIQPIVLAHSDLYKTLKEKLDKPGDITIERVDVERVADRIQLAIYHLKKEKRIPLLLWLGVKIASLFN